MFLLERITNFIGIPDMSDNPLDHISSFDMVSFRAVLVAQGEDPGQALSDAGIIDPVALPVILGDNPTLPTGILGDGLTPNIVAVLQTEQPDGVGDAEPAMGGRLGSGSQMAQPARAFTKTLPAAFGNKPLAPVRQRGG